MADYQTLRNNPDCIEPLDPEIIPLTDAMNAAGFVTTQSCCGHGTDWPRVWFVHSSDERIESMARYVIKNEEAQERPYHPRFCKEIFAEGYGWALELHLDDVYATTPQVIALAMAVTAINNTAQLIEKWANEKRG